MEFFAGLIAGAFFPWAALAGFFALAVIFELCEYHRSSAVSVVVLGVLGYLIFRPDWLMGGIYALTYIGLGITFSFFRYKQYITDKLDKLHGTGVGVSSRAALIESLHPTKMWDRLISWTIIWPISLLDNGLRFVVQNMFRGVYMWIYTKSIGEFEANESRKDG